MVEFSVASGCAFEKGRLKCDNFDFCNAGIMNMINQSAKFVILS